MKVWEACNGVGLIDTGKKRRSGKPHLVMAIEVLVVMSEADAKLVSKKHPRLKFVAKTRPKRSLPTGSKEKSTACTRAK